MAKDIYRKVMLSWINMVFNQKRFIFTRYPGLQSDEEDYYSNSWSKTTNDKDAISEVQHYMLKNENQRILNIWTKNWRFYVDIFLELKRNETKAITNIRSS